VDLRRLVPPTDPTDLPLWEGVRVLANRLLEHVKVDEGVIGPERAVAKSYEALAEAYLVAEGRYRPSYTERLAELDHSPVDAPPELVAAMRTVLRNRLSAGSGRPPGLAQARTHLIDGLGLLAARYSGGPGRTAPGRAAPGRAAPGPASAGLAPPAGAELARLARTERHWRHRLYWAVAMLRERRARDVDLGADPILRVWQRALAYVTTGATSAQRRLLLRDWRACPQLLVSRRAARREERP